MAQVSKPVEKILTHCSLPKSQILSVLALPPTVKVPVVCCQENISPEPREVSATSGRARNDEAREMFASAWGVGEAVDGREEAHEPLLEAESSLTAVSRHTLTEPLSQPSINSAS